MPIYEYRCQSCGHELEQLQRISDPALSDCPACGKSELRRLISAAGFRLKGAGWYETDFKQGNKRNLADGGDGAKTESPAPEKKDKPAEIAKDTTAAKPGDGKSSKESKSGAADSA